MSDSSLKIIAPDKGEHHAGIFDLISKVFGSNYFNFHDECCPHYLMNSHYDWHTSRIGIMDDRIVTHWGVWKFQMRVGKARVICGNIGAVATHGHYRKRGLISQTAQASLDAMRGAGYDLSYLSGIADFYHRFGYVRAWSPTNYYVTVDELPEAKPNPSPRKFKVVHRDDIASIYNSEHATDTGTAVRPTYLGRYFPSHNAWDGYLWRDEAGSTDGYLVFRHINNRIQVGDFGGDLEQILRVAGWIGRRFCVKELEFRELTSDRPMAKYLRRGNCRMETIYYRNAKDLACIINLRSTLEKISGELETRLKASPLAGWKGSLLIDCGRESTSLIIDGGKVSVGKGRSSKHAVHGGGEIVQFILGTDDPAEIAEAAGMKLRGDAGKLIEALFPNQHPGLCICDMA